MRAFDVMGLGMAVVAAGIEGGGGPLGRGASTRESWLKPDPKPPQGEREKARRLRQVARGRLAAAERLHRQAMFFCDRADTALDRGWPKDAELCFRKAVDLECRAADAVNGVEPSHTVLFRSAQHIRGEQGFAAIADLDETWADDSAEGRAPLPMAGAVEQARTLLGQAIEAGLELDEPPAADVCGGVSIYLRHPSNPEGRFAWLAVHNEGEPTLIYGEEGERIVAPRPFAWADIAAQMRGLTEEEALALVRAGDPPAFRRAGGDVTCDDCGRPYRKHPLDPTLLGFDGPFLNRLCSGELVKL